jgi:putative transcriptional regulator
MIKYNLAELIAKERFKIGRSIPITEISKKTGISKATLYRMTNSSGKFSTKTEYIEKLCALFGCTPNDLMTIIPDPTGKESGKSNGD